MMAGDAEVTAECADCGSFPLAASGPCPLCGGERRRITARDTINLTITERCVKTREYFENHPRMLVAVIALTLGSFVIGLVVAGPVGVAIGLVLGIICLFIGFYARTKVREIERGGDRQ